MWIDRTGICSSKEEEFGLEGWHSKILQDQGERYLQALQGTWLLVTRDTHEGTLKMSQSEYIDSLLKDSI